MSDIERKLLRTKQEWDEWRERCRLRAEESITATTKE